MSNLFKKLVTGVATSALVLSMVFVGGADANAATAGGVYSTPDGTVWFVTSDMQKRPFTSAGAFLSYGFLSFAQVMPADASVTSLPTGAFIAPADGKIFCAASTKGSDVAGECALITGSMKAAFTSAAVFSAQGHTFDRAITGDSSFLTKTGNIDNGSAAHLPGVLINNNGTVQMVVTGGLWGIPSIEVFNSWGYSFADVVPANSADLSKVQIGVIPGRMAGQLVPTGTVGGVPSNPTNPNGTFNPNGGTQGSISNLDLGSREDTEALEGENDVEIYAVDVDMNDDGPLKITSADVWFAEVNGAPASSKPWDYFTEVSLMLNGQTLATMDADSSSDWSSVTDGNINAAGSTREYRMRFANINGVLPSDDISNLSVAVSMMNNLDSDDEGAEWFVELGQIRVLDESGFSVNENTNFNTSTTLEESFTVGGADEASLEVRDADEEIDAQVIEVSKTSNTNGVSIYTFEVEETNDVDVNIEEMTLTFSTGLGGGTTTENSVIRRASLWIGNTQVSADKSVPNGGTVVFNNLDIDVDADDQEEITVRVDLYDTNTGARYSEGTTLEVQVDSIDIVTDANGNDEDDLTININAVSNSHELRTEGIMLSFVSQSTTTNTDATPDQGTFQIVFDVTGFGEDQTVSADCLGGEVAYFIDGSGADTSCVVSAPGQVKSANGNYLVKKNETRRFTLSVVLSGGNDFSNVQLTGIDYESDPNGATDSATPGSTYNFNLEDFRTNDVFLSNS